MKKLKLEIIGLSYSQTQSGAYALVLGESKGKRRLPIIIGSFEAQSIAIALENMTPSRPLTHDLFKHFAEAFAINISEVVIYNLVEGIFYAKLVSEHNNEKIEIDTRTSDAVAIAVRFKCPIYTFEFILSAAGIILDEDVKEKPQLKESTTPKQSSDIKTFPIEKLEKLLKQAVDSENYEKASFIRDELKRRKEAS